MVASKPQLHRHGDAQIFASAVADRLHGELRQGLRDRHAASFAVPGGTTPGPIFDDLANRDLDWPKVTVTLTDERWVPSDDPASNEALLRSRLVTGKARDIRVISLHDAAAAPSAGVADITRRLAKLPLPFDVVMLGMGGDGHFASLFPGMATLMGGLSLDSPSFCVASDQPINGQPRISLTLQLLLQSRVILLAVRGADKMKIIERAATATPDELPIAALLTQSRAPVEIHYTD
jgi:6-phosphogluconolactonase